MSQKANLSISLVDESGRHASVPFFLLVDEAQTVAEQATEATAMGSLVDALSDCQVIGVHFGLEVASGSGWKTAPTVGGSAWGSALFAFGCGSARTHWPAVIPGISASKKSGGKVVLTDGDVAAFVGHVLATGTGYRYVSAVGQELDDLGWVRLVVRRWGHTRRR